MPGADKVANKGISPLKTDQTTKKKATSAQKKLVGSTGSSASPMPAARHKTPATQVRKAQETPKTQQNTSSAKTTDEKSDFKINKKPSFLDSQ